MGTEGPTEADYAEGARVALERRDMRLALEQIGGALSFRPLAHEHRAMLDLILSRTSRPLELLPRCSRRACPARAVNDRALQLVPLLFLYRGELPPVEDPLATALRDVLARVRAEPPKGPVRLRVRLDGPVPATARRVFAAKLAEVGQVGEIDADGDTTSAPLAETNVDETSVARVRAVASSRQTVDTWCTLTPGLSLADARAAADHPSPDSDPIVALDRHRAAAFALAAAGAADRGAVVAWLQGIATGDDGWAARPALMVLAAMARRFPEQRGEVRRIFESARTKDDARSITLLGCWCLLPDLDSAERGAGYKAWQEARIRRR